MSNKGFQCCSLSIILKIRDNGQVDMVCRSEMLYQDSSDTSSNLKTFTSTFSTTRNTFSTYFKKEKMSYIRSAVKHP